MRMRVVVEFSHFTEFEVDVDDADLEDSFGEMARTSDEVMNLLYRNEGLQDEILYNMPKHLSDRLEQCAFDVHSVEFKAVEVLDEQ